MYVIKSSDLTRLVCIKETSSPLLFRRNPVAPFSEACLCKVDLLQKNQLIKVFSLKAKNPMSRSLRKNANKSILTFQKKYAILHYHISNFYEFSEIFHSMALSATLGKSNIPNKFNLISDKNKFIR